jgi:hypothetical protein
MCEQARATGANTEVNTPSPTKVDLEVLPSSGVHEAGFQSFEESETSPISANLHTATSWLWTGAISVP